MLFWARCVNGTEGAERQPLLPPGPLSFPNRPSSHPPTSSFPPAMAEDRPLSTVNSEYGTPAPSLPALDGPLEPPRASFFSGPGPSIGESSIRDSRADSATGPENDKEGTTPGQSTTLLPVGKEEGAVFSDPASRARPFYRRPAGLAVALGALVAVVLAIALPVSLVHKGKHSQSNGSSGNGNGNGNGTGSGPGNGNPNSPTNTSNAITGGDGSTITSGNTSFVYHNSFGGICEFFSPWVLLRM